MQLSYFHEFRFYGSNKVGNPISPTLLLWIGFTFGVFSAQIEVRTQSTNMFSFLIPIWIMVYIITGETLNCSEDTSSIQIQNFTFPGGYVGSSVNLSWGEQELGDLLPCVS